MAGRPGDAFAIFEQVAAIAERFDDRDLRTLGRLGRGQSLIAMAETRRGVPLLDEAMTAVIAGEISPIVSGIVYCAVIEACQSTVRPPARAGMDRGAGRAGGNRSPTWSRSAATASSFAPS